ncbi:hypothetical protein OG497_37840 [Streptomyces sp. NBC_01242]|uniref:hypothetical protein n=1 Tax=Streptomyces sp. NBC_01242 TaxID=2903795 RepID=UPI002257F0C4|nr:hypothetical protein [Streptomyces sp. NBC_01242]MCX4799621.1 hypothetical protein [Streptomyces sp. NBC_01242]
MTAAPDTAAFTVCPLNPFGHKWGGPTATACQSCPATRTAAEALVSLVGGWEGWDADRAAALVAQHAAEVAAPAPTA